MQFYFCGYKIMKMVWCDERKVKNVVVKKEDKNCKNQALYFVFLMQIFDTIFLQLGYCNMGMQML